MPVMQYKPLYTTKEAAEVLATSRNAVYEMLKAGMIPYLRLNGSMKIRGTDLERFIETYPVESPAGVEEENS